MYSFSNQRKSSGQAWVPARQAKSFRSLQFTYTFVSRISQNVHILHNKLVITALEGTEQLYYAHIRLFYRRLHPRGYWNVQNIFGWDSPVRFVVIIRKTGAALSSWLPRTYRKPRHCGSRSWYSTVSSSSCVSRAMYCHKIFFY
jgi:hypothetical protein